MLKRVTLNNFQSFLGQHDAILERITLFFGPNSSGKSSSIRALNALRESYSKGNSIAGFGHGFSLRSAEATIFGQLKTLHEPRTLSYGFTVDTKENKVLFGIAECGSEVTTIFGEDPEKTTLSVTLQILVTEDVRKAASENLGVQIQNKLIKVSLQMSLSEEKIARKVSIPEFDEEIEALFEALFRANGTWGEVPDGSPYPVGNVEFDDRNRDWNYSWQELVQDASSRLRIIGPQLSLGERDLPDWDEGNWVQWLEGADSISKNRLGLLAAILEELYIEGSRIFSKIQHIPALREIPQKITQQPRARFIDQVQGHEGISEALLELTEGRYSDKSKKFKIPETEEIYYSNILYDNFTGADVTFDEVGAGISQIYPALVSLFDDSEVVYIEQPELHLHPKMQAKFMDIAIDCLLKNTKKQLILETHSENILLRLQKRIRDGKVPREESAVLFVDRENRNTINSLENTVENRSSAFTKIEIDEMGDLIDPLPLSFVDLRLADLL